jgi:glycosyltransferase involved in cell wall biosynthesis
VRVLAWVPQEPDTSPGQRYRIEQWEPLLRREGIELAYSPFADHALGELLKSRGAALAKARGVMAALARRLIEAGRVTRFDLVYVFREGALLGPALAERILGWNGVPFVFDFDDAVWLNYKSPANPGFSRLRFPGKTASLCRLARHVIAGNAFLRDYALVHNPRVSVVPTTIDTDRYRPSPRPGSVPVVGWTGSYSTAQYLRIVRPVLERLRLRRAFRVVIVGVAGFEARGVEVEHRPWRSASEVEDLSDIDVGLMPLTDAEWERGKCGLKALQYMALGIPALVSPVGVNTEIVRDGENGLLASTEADWERSLDRLLSDAELRRRLGAAGRATVESTYSARVQAPRVAAIFREALRGTTPSAGSDGSEGT